MTDRHFSSDPQFDADEMRDMKALGIGTRRLAGCPDPAMVLALDEGVLDEDVAARVRLHVSSCPACRTAAGDLANVFEGEIPPEMRRRIDERVATFRTKPARGLWYWLVPAGGLTLLTAGLALFFLRPVEPPAVPATQMARGPSSTLPTVFIVDRPAIPPGEVDLAVRGEATRPADLENQVALGLDRADAGDVTGALSELTALARKHPDSRLTGLALGALQLRDNRNSDALATLERARVLATDPDRNDEIEWYLSIALVRNGQLDRARGLLETICKHNGPRSARACAGVAEIDRTRSK